MRTLLLITLIFFGFGAITLTPDSYAADCSNASDQSTLNQCANKDDKKSDTELNKLYKDVQIRLREQPDRVKKLVSAQRAWIIFRDVECDFATLNTQGGSAYGSRSACVVIGLLRLESENSKRTFPARKAT